MKTNSLRPLAITFALSGIWDLIAGLIYFFIIGSGRKIDNPPTDIFYSVFLGSFFLCFSYLQFLSAFNIKRYAFNVGCLTIGRAFYIIQLYIFIGCVEGFPSMFWLTGIVDFIFTVLYLVFAMRGGLKIRDLFLPEIEFKI